MDFNFQLCWRRLACHIAALTTLAGSAFATLELPDQLDVGGGLGPVAASFEAITNEVGYVVDDTFDGEITFNWTMKWDAFAGVNASNSWALFHFFSGKNRELSGLGNDSLPSQIGTFNEAGVGRYNSRHQSGTEIVAGKDYTFTLVVDYHAGAPDSAVLNGGGFVDQSLASGDWGFHHIRTRVSRGATNQVDFTKMLITSSGIGNIEPEYEQVDPRFPGDRQTEVHAEWTRWPRARIRQLEAERNQLLKKISLLPQHHPIYLSTRLGYHSRFEEAGSPDALLPHQIDFKWSWKPLLDSIALVPAFNPKQPEIYAFPKRFKIEVLTYETGNFETVVDWMDEDFPDPGLYPVFFAGINRQVTQVRITVPQVVRESGMAYSALGEVYVLRQRPDGSTGGNMAVWDGCHVEASDSFSMPPLWDIEYLHDGLVGLGFSLSDETVESEDLRIVFEGRESPDEMQLLLDLGQVQKIGRIDFWPAAPPAGLALPSFGFPGDISVELSLDPDFQTVKVVAVKNDAGNMPRENLLSVAARGYKARYLRVTMKELGEYKGKRILGLGEILVSEFEQALSVNCKVSAQGIPEEYLDQLPRLVDGCSWQRRILPQGEWIKGLAQRRPLDRRLIVVERELELARATWSTIKLRAGILGGSIVFVTLVGWVVVQRWMRKRGIDKLKWRITRDLHDDVGSNLGSIALTAEKLKHADMNAEVRQAINDLTLLAREAFASLREVVWVVNESTIRLPMLIQKLGERAERVLGAERVVVEISPDCPDCIVPLTLKRHLIMIFKEIVHNCARHAQAIRVRVKFSMIDQFLQITVRDNGCGFDAATPSDGWGLESMKERAREIGGKLEVESQVGEGTTVVLTVPLTSLMSEANHLYKTSN